MLPPGMESEPTPPRTGKKRGRPKKIPIEGELPPLEQGIACSQQSQNKYFVGSEPQQPMYKELG